MWQLLDTEPQRLVVYMAILAGSVAVTAYVVSKLRGDPVQHEPKASELMSKFRELHSRGELSDAEFRTIKTALAKQLQNELKDTGETGYDE